MRVCAATLMSGRLLMKKTTILCLTFLLSLMLVSCSNKSARTPIPETGFSLWEKAYLLVNNIEISDETISLQRPGYEGTVRYPQISGLLDQTVQEAINGVLRHEAESFIHEQPSDHKAGAGYYMSMYWHVAANYNNVLGITVFKYAQEPENYKEERIDFLFDLNTGSSLELKDLFADKDSCLTLVSNAVKEEIIRQNMEEETLYRPFDRIDEHQPFTVTASELVIHFPRGNPYFIYGSPLEFTLPFSSFGDEVIVYSKYQREQSIYEKPVFKKHMLPGPTTVKRKAIEKAHDSCWIEAAYVELQNVPDSGLQERLNRQFAEESLAFAAEPEFIRQANETFKEDNSRVSHKNRHMYVSANYADILCIVQSDFIYQAWNQVARHTSKTFLYNSQTGRPLLLDDLFCDGTDYVLVFERYIRQEIINLGREITLPQPIVGENTRFYLDGENFYIYSLNGTSMLESYGIQPFIIPFEAFGENALVFHSR
jgi:hypothetical protein